MISAHQKRDKERMDSLLECSTRDTQWSRQLWNTFNASRHAVHATLLSQSGVPLPGRQQAASFIQLYSSKHALDDSPPCRQYRIALRDQLAHLPTYCYPLSKGDPFPLVHSAEIRAAIHSIRMGQAADIMGLHPILILHIAGMVMRQLCQLFNSCFSHGFVPRLWKSSIVIPILKPNKPRSVASSYEPESIISLLSLVNGSSHSSSEGACSPSASFTPSSAWISKRFFGRLHEVFSSEIPSGRFSIRAQIAW